MVRGIDSLRGSTTKDVHSKANYIVGLGGTEIVNGREVVAELFCRKFQFQSNACVAGYHPSQVRPTPEKKGAGSNPAVAQSILPLHEI